MQHGGDIDLAIKKYGGQRADWIDLSTGINRTSYPWQESVKVELRDLPSSKLLIGLEKAASRAYKVAEGTDTAAVQGAADIPKQSTTYMDGIGGVARVGRKIIIIKREGWPNRIQQWKQVELHEQQAVRCENVRLHCPVLGCITGCPW